MATGSEEIFFLASWSVSELALAVFAADSVGPVRGYGEWGRTGHRHESLPGCLRFDGPGTVRQPPHPHNRPVRVRISLLPTEVQALTKSGVQNEVHHSWSWAS